MQFAHQLLPLTSPNRNQIMNLTRRHFIGASSAAVIVAGMKAQGKVFGANDRIRVLTVGFNGRGQSHIKGFLDMKDEGVEMAGLCDVDQNVLAAGGKQVEKASGRAPKLVKDVRDAVTSKEIDVVSTATPNHWHPLVTMLALQAGKDAYVEKPMSHNIYEGRQVVAAAKKYNTIVQHGTQSR